MVMSLWPRFWPILYINTIREAGQQGPAKTITAVLKEEKERQRSLYSMRSVIFSQCIETEGWE